MRNPSDRAFRLLLDRVRLVAPASPGTHGHPEVRRQPPPSEGAADAATRLLADIASGDVPPNAARVRAALAVLARAPTPPPIDEPHDLGTPECEERVLREFEALPARLLVAALERGRLRVVGG